MKSILIFLTLTFTFSFTQAQDEHKTIDTSDELPYYEIPDAPEEYTAEGVAARMIDGLGYRYYWATEGLRDEDLEYQASETNRTTEQTLKHILGLSKTIINAASKKPNVRGSGNEEKEPTFEEMRKQTLTNLKTASDLLREKDAKLEDMKLVFQREERKSEFPFWNMINGPIADALWHTGQVVSFRRASGNPLPPGVSVLNGKTRK